MIKTKLCPSEGKRPRPTLLEVATLAEPKVAVLLCTYNGESFLGQQLDSLADQTHTQWQVWASDDGSTDTTRAILKDYAQKWKEERLQILSGPAKGYARNFLSLVCNKDLQAQYYAYCDQDDIWEPDRLARALDWIQTVPAEVPALYCARTRLVDAQNNPIGLSPLFTKLPSFANALMQNIGGGNTMLFNNATRTLLRAAGPDLSVISHDWWTYLVVTGCGGQVFYDSTPTVRYRQHQDNMFGMNCTWSARLRRIHMLWQGYFRDWNDNNIVSLAQLETLLTPQNRKILARFTAARQMSLVPRLVHLKRSGIYRQTMLGNLGLLAAAIFGKI